MKLVLVAATALLALTACGSSSADVATDPEPSAPSASATGPALPVPAGEVSTRGLVTVIDADGDGPELCLGAVAESYPPQCGGPSIEGWGWDTTGHDMFETQGDARWGSYLVTGTWDGTAFTATSAIPAAVYDPAAPSEEPTPTPATAYDATELDDIAAALSDQLPGALGTAAVMGHVLLDVVYDDGSLQNWADETYGAGVVLVSSALVDEN